MIDQSSSYYNPSLQTLKQTLRSSNPIGESLPMGHENLHGAAGVLYFLGELLIFL
jgi:hypothetical protein